MINLEKAKRSNILYGMARCFGLEGRDGEVSRLPLDKMPTGYLEYITFFYNAPEKSIVSQSSCSSDLINVFKIGQVPKCPTDYFQWAETMLSNFGSRWLCLHRALGGPKSHQRKKQLW